VNPMLPQKLMLMVTGPVGALGCSSPPQAATMIRAAAAAATARTARVQERFHELASGTTWLFICHPPNAINAHHIELR
jgi:hypothetical protein